MSWVSHVTIRCTLLFCKIQEIFIFLVCDWTELKFVRQHLTLAGAEDTCDGRDGDTFRTGCAWGCTLSTHGIVHNSIPRRIEAGQGAHCVAGSLLRVCNPLIFL